MRRLPYMSLAGLIVLMLATCAFTTASAETVVVELFTSEGCSSCPPADVLLRDLGERDDVIILAWHVDYWDRLGWKDPYGDPAYTKRQETYARAMGLRTLYTPQMVVNGKAEFVGSDRRRALAALKAADGEFPVKIAIQSITVEEDVARVSFTVDKNTVLENKRTQYLAVVTEDDLVTRDIPRGENRGRTLEHDGVVRAAGILPKRSTNDGALSVSIPLDEEWNRENLDIVILAEETGGEKRILGASVAALEP